MTIESYLIADTRRYGNRNEYCDPIKYELEIVQIKEEDNPFYLPCGDVIKQWELKIKPMVLYDGGSDWIYCLEKDYQLLKFKMSCYMKPHLEVFSGHIRDECLAVIKALGIDLSTCYIWDLSNKLYINRNEIEVQSVYSFTRNIYKYYHNTEDFLKVFDHYQNRMYHCIKFMSLLINGISDRFRMSWDYPIGEHFLAFLTNNAKFFDYYK